jgi:hypothetical protein
MARKARVEHGKPQRVYVTPEVKEALIAWADRRTITDLGLLTSKILRWFLEQDEPVQTAIVQRIDRGLEPAYAAVLRELAKQIEKTPRAEKPKRDPRPITLAVEDEGNVRFEEYPSSPKTARDERGRPTA